VSNYDLVTAISRRWRSSAEKPRAFGKAKTKAFGTARIEALGKARNKSGFREISGLREIVAVSNRRSHRA
jgi:hypothetical protein